MSLNFEAFLCFGVDTSAFTMMSFSFWTMVKVYVAVSFGNNGARHFMREIVVSFKSLCPSAICARTSTADSWQTAGTTGLPGKWPSKPVKAGSNVRAAE